MQTSFEYCFYFFIQTDLSEATIYFVRAIIRQLRQFLYSGDGVSFGSAMDVHWTHPCAEHFGQLRCANRLSYRFDDTRYNLNRTTALLTGFYFYPKTRIIFCACVPRALSAMLV